MAAVLIAMNGPAARGLCRCSARATSSLPVPDSPVMSTVVFDCERRPIARKTSCIAGAWPSISGAAPVSASTGAGRRRLDHRAADERDGVIDVERLRQILEGAALERRDRAVEIRVRGHDDHRQLRAALLHLVEQHEARFARHPDVGDEHRRLARRERLQHLRRGHERPERNVLARERFLEHPADRAVVVDDPDGLHRPSFGRAVNGDRFACGSLTGPGVARPDRGEGGS